MLINFDCDKKTKRYGQKEVGGNQDPETTTTATILPTDARLEVWAGQREETIKVRGRAPSHTG